MANKPHGACTHVWTSCNVFCITVASVLTLYVFDAVQSVLTVRSREWLNTRTVIMVFCQGIVHTLAPILTIATTVTRGQPFTEAPRESSTPLTQGTIAGGHICPRIQHTFPAILTITITWARDDGLTPATCITSSADALSEVRARASILTFGVVNTPPISSVGSLYFSCMIFKNYKTLFRSKHAGSLENTRVA